MFGALIGSALGAVGGILGSASKNEKLAERRAQINKRKRENEDWYNRRYNEDVTQRADAQRIITMTEDAIKRRNRAAEGRAAVMGGTDESVAAEKERNNQTMADVYSQIAAAGEARKDAIEQQYLNKKEKLDDALEEVESQRSSGMDAAAAAIGGATKGAILGSSIGGGSNDGLPKKLTNKQHERVIDNVVSEIGDNSETQIGRSLDYFKNKYGH